MKGRISSRCKIPQGSNLLLCLVLVKFFTDLYSLKKANPWCKIQDFFKYYINILIIVSRLPLSGLIFFKVAHCQSTSICKIKGLKIASSYNCNYMRYFVTCMVVVKIVGERSSGTLCSNGTR